VVDQEFLEILQYIVLLVDAVAVAMKELSVSVSWWKAFPTSPPLDIEAGERFRKRKGRMNDVVFIGACTLAGIEPTPRQARKWNNGKGLAIRYRNTAKATL
jgi:hypothetical protein